MKRYLQVGLILFFALYLPKSALAQCDPAVNLSAVNGGGGAGINSVDLSWDPVTGADFYSVRYRIAGSMDTWSVKNLSGTSITISGLPSLTDYEWMILTICEPDWSEVSEFSALDFFTTGAGVECTAVTNLTAGNITDSSVDLSWTAGTGAIQYYIQYRIPSIQSWAEADYIFTLQPTGKTITGLVLGQDYEVRVRTICALDWSSISEYSSIISFSTDGCAIPVNLAATPSVFTADLSWDAIGGIVEYEVKWRESGSGVWNNTATPTVNSLTINGLTPSTDYEWIIRTVCQEVPLDLSDFSAIQMFTTQVGATCDTPTTLASTPAATMVDLTWDAMPSALEYELKYRISGGSVWTNSAFTGTNSATLINLNPTTNYEWIIRSVCTVDRLTNSAFSAVQNFTTLAGATCDFPTSLSSTPSSNTTILNWDAMPLALNYDIRWREQGSPSFTNSQITSSNTLVISSLNPLTTYEWIIKTLCSPDMTFDSPFSGIQSFTTTAGVVCVVPSNLASNPDVNTADLSWDALIGALSYEIKYRESGTLPYLNRVETSNTNATLVNLNPNQQYDWIIRTLCSVDGTNNSAYSAIQNFTTDPGATCETPSNLAATPTSNSATVSWDAVAAALEYEIKWREFGSVSWTKSTIIPAATSTVLNNLTASTTHEWIIRGYCSVDRVFKSNFSSIQTFTTSAGGMRILNENPEVAEELSIPEWTEERLDIYPNPTKGDLNIRFSSNNLNEKEIYIYNSVGKILSKLVLKPNQLNSFDLSGLASGVYMVKVMINKKPVVKRVILQ